MTTQIIPSQGNPAQGFCLGVFYEGGGLIREGRGWPNHHPAPPEPKCQPTTANQLSALLNQLYQL